MKINTHGCEGLYISEFILIPEEVEDWLGLALAAHFAAFAGSVRSFFLRLETKKNLLVKIKFAQAFG